MSINLLQLVDIHAAYLQKDVLRGVTLEVRTGEFVIMLGENGSGKSSVLKVATGLLHPSTGAVRYRGQNINGLSVTERQHLGIGYLIQGGHVFPNLTVKENFSLASSHARRGRRGADQSGDWFPPLKERLHERAGLLSGGLRQMLAIELVLAQHPEMLLLDEPTGSLSEDVSRHILALVREYVDENASAALVVEHALAATEVATRCVNLEHGVISKPDRS